MTQKSIQSRAENSDLMKMGDRAFWEEFEEKEERYVVIDKRNGEIIAKDIRLVKAKKRVKV